MTEPTHKVRIALGAHAWFEFGVDPAVFNLGAFCQEIRERGYYYSGQLYIPYSRIEAIVMIPNGQELPEGAVYKPTLN